MLGTILFSSKIRYGQNKRNVSYYLFIPDDSHGKYIVASKKGKSTKIDHYAKIEILENEIKYFETLLEPHDCGFIYTTISFLKERIENLKGNKNGSDRTTN